MSQARFGQFYVRPYGFFFLRFCVNFWEISFNKLIDPWFDHSESRFSIANTRQTPDYIDSYKFPCAQIKRISYTKDTNIFTVEWNGCWKFRTILERKKKPKKIERKKCVKELIRKSYLLCDPHDRIGVIALRWQRPYAKNFQRSITAYRMRATEHTKKKKI